VTQGFTAIATVASPNPNLEVNHDCLFRANRARRGHLELAAACTGIASPKRRGRVESLES